MAQHHHLDRRVRFLLAGGFASGISWLSRFLFSTLMSYAAAVAVATAVGMMIGFVTYRSYVFPDSRQSLGAQLVGFLFVNLAGAAVTITIAIAVRTLLSPTLGPSVLTDPTAHAVGIAVGAATNYLGHKSITFRTI
ncbi:GtrA family protein [Methylobacterium sp. NMS14P]|uniref:GtrA family protein n=1 Tax=Methylobacterium sp. NMS14P TaxID=2894310 RepID=UPI0023599DDA|nr:GtrA family protein [Methylobacterium sp. NMS14P]WCS23812.1 GtrA family protein [Methylobacterium sp. NMS14P]